MDVDARQANYFSFCAATTCKIYICKDLLNCLGARLQVTKGRGERGGRGEGKGKGESEGRTVNLKGILECKSAV